MRGCHINRLLLLYISLTAPIHAYRSVTGRSHHTEGRTEKDRKLGVFAYNVGGTRCRHHAHVINGRVHESTVTEDGSAYIQPLAYTAERRKDKKGVRWYHVVRIACPNGDHSVHGDRFHEERIPLTAQPSDKAKNFNHAEHLRLLPPGIDLYDLVKGWRVGSESLHSEAEFAFHGHRLPAYHARSRPSSCSAWPCASMPAPGGCSPTGTSTAPRTRNRRPLRPDATHTKISTKAGR